MQVLSFLRVGETVYIVKVDVHPQWYLPVNVCSIKFNMLVKLRSEPLTAITSARSLEALEHHRPFFLTRHHVHWTQYLLLSEQFHSTSYGIAYLSEQSLSTPPTFLIYPKSNVSTLPTKHVPLYRLLITTQSQSPAFDVALVEKQNSKRRKKLKASSIAAKWAALATQQCRNPQPLAFFVGRLILDSMCCGTSSCQHAIQPEQQQHLLPRRLRFLDEIWFMYFSHKMQDWRELYILVSIVFLHTFTIWLTC